MKKPKRPRDPNQLAKLIVEITTGERPNDSPKGPVAFGNAIDYAMLVKTYEGDSGKHTPAERRYSLAVCTGEFKQRITGDPDPANISTSYVERQNLTCG